MVSSLDPRNLNNSRINEESRQDQLEELKDDVETLKMESLNERLGLPPAFRVFSLAFTAAIVGSLGGMMHGWKTSSLRYLASNSHRLPTTYNGWFFYHKRKMYYCLKQGMIVGFKTGAKLGGFVGCIFAVEAGFDKLRGVKDFCNTMMAVCIPGVAYSWWHRIPRVQANDFIRKGGRIGIGFGLLEDLFQYIRGADVWYLRRLFGIQPRSLTERIRDRIRSDKNKL